MPIPTMGIQRKPAIFLFLSILALVLTSQPHQKSLASIYQEGKIRLVPEMVLDSASLPKDVLFVGPVDVATDHSGHIFVLDFSDNNIKKFDDSGKFIKAIGRKGQGPGEFNMPLSFALAKDRLAVWDMGNQRLCTLTLEGELIQCENISFLAARPTMLRALPNGDFIVETEKIYFNEQDKPQDCILEMISPELKPKKTVCSHPVWRNKYIRIQQGLANLPQPYSPDLLWNVSSDGKIVVGFSETYELTVYDSEGARLFGLTHPYDRIKVTENDKKDFFEGMTHTTPEGIEKGAPDYIVKNTKFPKVKPAFNDILVDPEGNIWIHPYKKNGGDWHKSFDIFNGRGEYINHLDLLGESSYPFRAKMFDGCMWIIETDKEGFFKITKYRLSE
jgi:hypothetical protein